jgi:nickel/cobalt exporter
MEKLNFFGSLILSGFAIAFMHALIPTHWLPFVLAAKSHKWTRSYTMTVVTLAGLGHVLFTAFLGVLIVWFGIHLSENFVHFFPFLAGCILVLIGVFYLIRSLRGHSHKHIHFFVNPHSESSLPYQGQNGGTLIDVGFLVTEVVGNDQSFRIYFYDHFLNPITVQNTADYQVKRFDGKLNLEVKHGSHFHRYEIEPPKAKTESATILSLFLMLTLSPCESFLPIYLSALRYNWYGFILLSLVLAAGTLLAMIAITWFTLSGVHKIKFQIFERFESSIMGIIMIALGMVLIFWKHSG